MDAIAFAATRARCRGDYRRRRRRDLATLSLDSLATLAGRAALRRALISDGACLLDPPDAATLAQRVAKCHAACSDFFARPYAEKVAHGAGDGPGQQHGWMEYLEDALRAYIFEVKVAHDAAYDWPSEGLRASADICLSAA